MHKKVHILSEIQFYDAKYQDLRPNFIATRTNILEKWSPWTLSI